MSVRPPERTGILGKLAKRLPTIERQDLFKHGAVDINLTNQCNARCAMCLESANERSFPPFTFEEVSGLLRQIVELPQGSPRDYLHLWGGEPFLDQKLLFGIIKEADLLGFKLIEIATNGFWGIDINNARAILSEMSQQIKGAQLAIQLSCDNFHQCQAILNPAYLANIIFLMRSEFSGVRLTLNSVILNNYQSLHDVAAAISTVSSGKANAFFDDREYYSFFYGRGVNYSKIEVSFFPLSLSGRCSPMLKDHFGTKPWKPEDIAEIDNSPEQHLSVGINRELYMNLQFTSPGILPMGRVDQHPIRDLVENIGRDPIAVSLMLHGYAEIYRHLKELFDFDSWIRQFYTAYDVLQGLEADVPCLVS